MHALITGGSGFLGRALTLRLLERGDQVTHLVRRTARTGGPVREVRWNPADAGSVNADEIGSVDAVFNFAGANVAKRWTKAYKRLIADSRIVTTRNLVNVLWQLPKPPGVLITASGLAIYGDRGDEPLTESSSPGPGFLSGVAIPWEKATADAASIGCRALTARFGMVMSAHGGGLPALVKPFRFGAGGRLGNGRQWTAWIHLDDAISALLFMAKTPELTGPVIVTAPGQVRNAELSRAIGQVMRRPSFLWMPGIAARLLLGQYVQELALASARATPQKLLQAGFTYQYPELLPCLERELGQR